VRKRCLLACLFGCLLLGIPGQIGRAEGSQGSCILLVANLGEPATSQVAMLHALIDILPPGMPFGLASAGGGHDLLAPAALDTQRRLHLHCYLDGMLPTAATAGELLRLAEQAVTRLDGDERLLLIWSASPLADRLATDLAQVAQTAGVRLLLASDPAGVAPLQGSAFRHNLLERILREIGLASATVDDGQGVFQVSDATESLALLALQDSLAGVQLRGPDGTIYQPDADDFPGEVYLGANYACLHLQPADLPPGAWSGEWRVQAGVQADLCVWLADQLRLQAEVFSGPGQRLVTASVWRGTRRVSAEELGYPEVLLLDGGGQPLVWLNDLGLNGDAVAADSVYTASLPPFLHPLAGQLTVQLQGSVVRQADVLIDAFQPLPRPARLVQRTAIITSLLLGGLGLSCVAALPAPEVVWRVRHLSATGYQREFPLQRPLNAGSQRRCPIRLSAASAPVHLCLRPTAAGGVELRVLAPDLAVLVNGQQAFLCSTLQHGDVIQIAGEQLIIEDLRQLRVGRYGSVRI
jgi:hypothetical protein